MLLCILSAILPLIHTAHIWHSITSEKPVACSLSNIYEQSASFVNNASSPISQILVDKNCTFGVYLAQNATFNMIYGVACKLSSCVSLEPCPRCVFHISATGPNNPHIAITDYDNISCKWNTSKSRTILLNVT